MSKTQHKITARLFLPVLAVVSLSTILLGNVKPAKATSSCSDVEVIFVHGAASDVDDSQDVAAWRAAFKNQNFGDLKLNFYNLGESNRYGARYNGADIGAGSLTEIKNTAETFFTAGESGEFNESVKQGITELSGRVGEIVKNCPNTKFVFGGYSEGAYLLHQFFRTHATSLGLTADKVVYIATFGDPKLYLPEGEGTNPPACRNEAFSKYRVYAPNCRANSGILGAERPDYFPANFLDQTGLWCTKKDVMCSNYFDLFNLSHILDDHLAYANSEPYAYKQAAILVRQKLNTIFGAKVSPSEESVHPAARDTAILIDTTGSMTSAIDQYKTEALKIAQDTVKNGGRIALYEYRDLRADGKEYAPKKLCDFSCTYEEFETHLANIETEGGGDVPESVLAASLGVLNELAWQKGATKSIVLLTDAIYHDADFDGTTLADVVKRSLEIDPVNFYVVVPNAIKDHYSSLVNATNGETFTLTSSDIQKSGAVLLNRPDLNFQFESYSSTTTEVATFVVDTSATDVDHFEWDLDLDGVFELSTSLPAVSSLYTAPVSGFVQARVVTKSGYTSSASALVTVIAEGEPANTPAIKTLEVEASESTAKVTFKKSENTSATVVILDDYILTLTKDEQFTMTELSAGEHTVTLVPISDTGLRGTPITKSFSNRYAKSNDAPLPKAPNTGSPRR